MQHTTTLHERCHAVLTATNKHLRRILSGCAVLLYSHTLPATDFSVYDLTCEQQRQAVGIDSRSPRFSWKINAQKRNFEQSSYRILVASDTKTLGENTGDVWDSGETRSDASILIPFEGKELEAAHTYCWKVRITDRDGNASDWSTPQTFTTGLFTEKDWNGAHWIALESDREKIVPALHFPEAEKRLKDKRVGDYLMPQFRKEFALKKKEVEQALIYISGLGHFELFLNGEKVGNHFLDPGWTVYDKEALYATFDVTSDLKEGNNTIGVMLGNGFYNIPNERYYKITGSYGAPKMKLNAVIRYTDGTVQNVVSGKDWKAAASPITYSSIYGGEDYDATREEAGWKRSGFNDKQWKNATISDIPVKLTAQIGTHLGVRDRLPVVKYYKNAKGYWLYDLGQNFSGIVRLKVKGAKGSAVLLRPAELLNPDSTVNQSASGEPYYFKYTLGGNSEEETWQPRFSYYGFRYIQVEGAVPEGTENTSGLPEITELEGLHTCNQAEENGTFSCSNPMFNKIYHLIDWAMRSNMASVLTDCPHREKLGWQEEHHLMQYSLQYRYDLSALYPKIMRDLKASQHANGTIPTIAPEYVRFADGFEDTPEWGSAFIICPWYLYKWYGDTRPIKEYYPYMKKYLDYLGSRAQNHIVAYGLGDWFDIGPGAPGNSQLTSNGITATAIYYYDTKILEDMARLLGEKDDEARFAALAQQIKKAYNDTFYHKDKGYYDRNSQTANAISLYMGLAEPSERPRILQSLVNDIRSRNNALTAGDIGYRYVLRALEAEGRTNVIYDMNKKYDIPGYGWQLAHGATALTESWQAYGFISNNHFMLGHLMEWLFSGLGGIRQQDESVAFKQILIEPQVVGDITSAATTYESSYGRISCEWKIENGNYTLLVAIPANTTAQIILPTKHIENVTEYGIPLSDKQAIKTETIGEKLRVNVGSGNYRFEISDWKEK